LLPGSARTILLATALTGLVEVVLFRLAAPVLSHIPDGPGGSTLAEAVRASGNSALRATALLAPLAVIALAGAVWSARRVQAVLLYAATAATLGATVLTDDVLALIAHGVTVLLVVALVAAAARAMPRTHALGVGLLAVSFVAGRWPLALDTVSGSGLSAVDSTGMAAQTIAEATLVAAPVALAISVVRRGVHSRRAWRMAAIGGIAVAVTLVFAPEYLAIMTLWASGVTLSLPQFTYVVAAACLGLVVGEWSAKGSSRHLAAGIVLVAVAGVTPTVVHHNLTAVAGLALLAVPSLQSALPAPSEKRG
jgi:hypothetical protein